MRSGPWATWAAWCGRVSESRNTSPVFRSGAPGVFRTPPGATAHMLEAMERFDLDSSSPDIEVLDGQMSVEELLADLGLEWRAGPAAADSPSQSAAEDAFNQPALF
jgi:hypothetical protein